MIIVFVLVWCSVLVGMEQEVLAPFVQKKLAQIPSLLTIAQRAVCYYTLDKKITIEDVQKLPSHEQELIQSLIMSEPKEVKGGEHYHLSTITPDHRYVLVTSNKGLLRLDLCTNETILVDDLKKDICARALSPSGNFTALVLQLHQKIGVNDIAQNGVVARKTSQTVTAMPADTSFNDTSLKEQQLPTTKERLRMALWSLWSVELEKKIWIKDIGQNKVIAEKSIKDILGASYGRGGEYSPSFIGEKILLLCNQFNAVWVSIKLIFQGSFKDFLSPTHFITTAQDCIICKKGKFLRFTAGAIKNQTRKNLKGEILTQAFYEPAMLIAYEQESEKGYIEIVSLKDWPEIATPLSCLHGGIAICALAFANKGQWLMIAEGQLTADKNKKGEYRLTIWDWQHNQELYTHKLEYPISYISSTDCCTPYPCLFRAGKMLYSLDPIKAVATGMLFQAAAQEARKAVATCHANNTNNNNNDISNDNGPVPITSRKTTKQDGRERKHKRPKN